MIRHTKTARKRAKDPVQERLRERKDLWNKACSNVISKLKSFKRSMNGYAVTEEGLPASKITQPVPQEVGAFLDQIASEYMSLIRGAEQIIHEQDEYSRSRQVSNADDGLTVEASSGISRLWAKTFGLYGRQDRDIILKMLNSCISAKEQLLELEDNLISSDPLGIPKAVNKSIEIGNSTIQNIITRFNILAQKNNIEIVFEKNQNNLEKSEGEGQADSLNFIKENLKKIKKIASEVVLLTEVIAWLSPKMDSSETSAAEDLLSRIDNLPDVIIRINNIKNNEAAKELYDKANDSLKAYDELFNLLKDKIEPEARSFEDIYNKFKEREKEVQASVMRDVRKFFMGANPFRNKEITTLKKICLEQADDALESLNALMDKLEDKKSTFSDILLAIKRFCFDLIPVYKNLSFLIEMNNVYYREDSYKKKSDKFVQISDSAKRKIQLIQYELVKIQDMKIQETPQLLPSNESNSDQE